MKPPRAFLLPCGTRFRHEKDKWSIEEPLDRLQHWIDFYKDMSARKNPRTGVANTKIYGPDYAVLRVLQQKLAQ